MAKLNIRMWLNAGVWVTTAPVVLVGILCLLAVSEGMAQTRETILRIHGSNTIGAKLAPALAEAFLKKMGADSVKVDTIVPKTEINVEGTFPSKDLIQVIEIRAHGSKTGFQGLKSGACDIAMSSTTITTEQAAELASLAPNGGMTGVASEHVVGLDGVAIVVNVANPWVSRLSLATLSDIFSGRIRNWKEFNGPDAPIVLHGRDENSGTHDAFQKIVLRDRQIDGSTNRWDSNDKVSDAVSANQYAIGYCGFPYVKQNKALGISDGGQTLRPTPFTIATEDYPISRRLYFYTPESPRNKYTQSFVAFALGAEGQGYVKKNQFAELTITAKEHEVSADAVAQDRAVVDAYLQAVRGARRLSLNFRFKTAKYDLDSRALRDLDRMVDFLQENGGASGELILAGFADSVGDYRKNCNLSRDRARTVQAELRSRGINARQVLGVCEELPVASNDSEWGKGKNRRVEVWVK